MHGFESEPMHAFPLRPMQAFRQKPTSGFHRISSDCWGKTFMRKKNPPLETRQSGSLREGILVLTLLLEQRACPIRGRLRGQMRPQEHRGGNGV